MTYIQDDVRIALVELAIVLLGIRDRFKVLQIGREILIWLHNFCHRQHKKSGWGRIARGLDGRWRWKFVTKSNLTFFVSKFHNLSTRYRGRRNNSVALLLLLLDFCLLALV